MKIAFFHELTQLSGARKVVNEYGKILSKDHQVDLYYLDEKEDLEVEKIFNKVHFFRFSSNHSRLYRDSIELVRLFLLHKKIAKIIKKNSYDCIFISPSKFTQSPFLLGLVNNAVYFCQEPLRIVYDPLMSIPEDLSIIKKSYELLNRRVRKLIDANNLHDASIVLCNSEFSRDNIYKAYDVNAKVCYLGVDVEKFTPKKSKKFYDLLFVGEQLEVEGYDLLKEVLKMYKKQLLVRYIARDESGESITEEELVKEINKSKIVLALSRNEPFGLLPLEAMSCGVPVVAVSEGGLKESVINGVTGYLIKRNKSELKAQIDLLLSNESLRNKLGKNSRERVLSKFTWDESVERFLAIIKQ
jgi:glycosyltransferase involved in cell wall biosynthesis